jgi:ribonuclease Z
LPLFGPPGVEEVALGFSLAYRQDAGFRTAHHRPEVVPPSGAGLTARAFAEPVAGAPVVVMDADGVRVTAFRVDHQPVHPAVGYRFDYGGRSVVISGDTKRSTEVEARAQGADLLVHEALSPELVRLMHDAAEKIGRANVAKIASDIPDYHTSPVEAAQLAAQAKVKHLLFTHVIPPLPLPGLDAAFLRGVDDAFDGGVTLGRDGSFVSLPRDSDAVEVSSR